MSYWKYITNEQLFTVTHLLMLKLCKNKAILGFKLRTASKEISKGCANPTFIILNLYVPICCTVNVSSGMNGFSPFSISLSVYLRPYNKGFILFMNLYNQKIGFFPYIINSHEYLDVLN